MRLSTNILQQQGNNRILSAILFSNVATAPSGPGPPHCRRFTITLRHTTIGRIPLDEWSAWHRDLYLTTHIEINRILNSGNAYHNSAQNLLPPRLLSKTVKFNTQNYNFASCFERIWNFQLQNQGTKSDGAPSRTGCWREWLDPMTGRCIIKLHNLCS
jgi:hypothetical protein